MEFKGGESWKRWLFPGLAGMAAGIMFILLIVKILPGNFTNTDSPVELSSTVHADDDNRETEVTAAVKKAKGAVVSITNYQGGSMFDGSLPSKAGSGSGVIYKKEDSKAFIITNHHVVDKATQLEATLPDGKKLKAKLLGSDPMTDLAVITVDGEGVNDVIEIGDSEDLQPGASAIAIGNPLGFLEGTVTKGVISSVARTMPVDIDQNGEVDWQTEVIQTDAAINPGNSGGALIDINGQLIGINSAKIALEEVEGIGFAIPVHAAAPVIESLEKYGEVRRPFIGVAPVSLQDIPSQYWKDPLNLPNHVTKGVVVMEVSPDSPAERAGIKKYDVITAIEGKKIRTVIDLRSFLFKDAKEGERVSVTIYRGGQKQKVTVELGTAR
ncbi:serine protease [Neobacillus piezotolerans]|uniref:Serine protease n=1 Tax=Neobacillus piezotolerans TaxID=2259171 RepID=A0A3D8GLI0_9BACI|nr:trypsin-like peptidase domain-containing protein [Neobacillus piezotolerans]RDU35258.1 serine protease [Neobacillus piezotolerans]